LAEGAFVSEVRTWKDEARGTAMAINTEIVGQTFRPFKWKNVFK